MPTDPKKRKVRENRKAAKATLKKKVRTSALGKTKAGKGVLKFGRTLGQLARGEREGKKQLQKFNDKTYDLGRKIIGKHTKPKF